MSVFRREYLISENLFFSEEMKETLIFKEMRVFLKELLSFDFSHGAAVMFSHGTVC